MRTGAPSESRLHGRMMQSGKHLVCLDGRRHPIGRGGAVKRDREDNMEKDKRHGGVRDLLIEAKRESRISEAVVFTDRALVRRVARANARAGINRFLLEVLAFEVEVDSVQASVSGRGEIVGVQYREVPVKARPQEEIRELEERRDALALQREGLKAERMVLDKQVRFLDSVVGFAETQMPAEARTRFPKADELKSMMTFLDGSYRDLSQKDGGVGKRIRSLDRELALVENRLKGLRRPGKKVRRGIEVVFRAAEEQEVVIEAAYVTGRVGWKPIYRVDIPLDLSGVHLNLSAEIRQESGENWRDAGITVSNALPLKGAALPEPEGWRLRLPPEYPDVPFAGALAAEVPAGAVEEMLEEPEVALLDRAGEGPGAGFAQAEERELPHAFEYALADRVTLDSAGGETLLPLFTREMAGEFFLHGVPRKDPLAYLVCRTELAGDLLPGKLNIHFGGRFVGSTALSERRAGEELLLNRGVDRAVLVRREREVDRVSETFFGMVDRASVARELAYRITVENLKKQPAVVRVFDAVPVPATDRIQVKGIEMAPEPTERDFQGMEGVMAWRMTLAPGATREVKIRFFVKHPKDRAPSGI